MGGRALPCLDQPKPATSQGLRGLHRLRRDLSLRRLRHAPHSTLGAVSVSFESDSKSDAATLARVRQERTPMKSLPTLPTKPPAGRGPSIADLPDYAPLPKSALFTSG